MQDVSIFISHHSWLSTSVVILLVILIGIELLRLRQHHFRLSPARITQLMNKDNAVIIDIRPNDIYALGHIIHAQSAIPQEIRKNAKKLLDKYKSRPIIIVCANGIESQKIAAFLLKQGYNSYSLSGGMRAWSEANMPIIKE